MQQEIKLLERSLRTQYSGGSFSSLRCLWSEGAPIVVELSKRLKESVPATIIGEGYGLSETIAHGEAITPLHRYKPGFLGIPHLNDIRIVDLATGNTELGPDEEGEITIKGPAVMQGYWNNPFNCRQQEVAWIAT